MNIFDNFRLKGEREDYDMVIESIDKGVVFKGTNLWILVFAIFIASLGLNVNSTAVIIGAMLVSPLMGPIMGLGLGMGINDITLLRKSLYNYLFAAGVGLVTSAVYFALSPINDAHSEILARTAPNIYDVLIATFGGFAGILATSSKQKGNVIPGVAIATALMPPLCTAGYGLATLQFTFFFGAIYLFLINTVFIALATLITVRYLKFPYKDLPDDAAEVKAQRIVWVIAILTLLPSIYFGYDIVQQDRFVVRANQFVSAAADFPNNYLLQKTIDPKTKTISLTYGGEMIEASEIENLRSKLPFYNLDTSSLIVQQGFSYLKEDKSKEEESLLKLALSEKDRTIQELRNRLDSLNNQKLLGYQIFNELKAQYPSIQSCILTQTMDNNESQQLVGWISVMKFNTKIDDKEKSRIEEWLRVRLQQEQVKIIFEFDTAKKK